MVERYLYDPYGKPTVLSATWTSQAATINNNEILFAGYRKDPETQLYMSAIECTTPPSDAGCRGILSCITMEWTFINMSEASPPAMSIPPGLQEVMPLVRLSPVMRNARAWSAGRIKFRAWWLR